MDGILTKPRLKKTSQMTWAYLGPEKIQMLLHPKWPSPQKKILPAGPSHRTIGQRRFASSSEFLGAKNGENFGEKTRRSYPTPTKIAKGRLHVHLKNLSDQRLHKPLLDLKILLMEEIGPTS